MSQKNMDLKTTIASELSSINELTQDEILARYPESVTVRWLRAGMRAMLRRQARRKYGSSDKTKANRILKKLSKEQIEQLAQKCLMK